MYNLFKLLGNWLRTLKVMRHDNKRLSTLQDLNVTLEKPSTDFPLFLVILFLFRLRLRFTTRTDLHERVFPASCGRCCREPVILRLPSTQCSCSRSTRYPAVGSRLYYASSLAAGLAFIGLRVFRLPG
jgi:hypothetical protein